MEKIYDKDGLLFLIQIDHLSGELIGAVIECFYSAGAKNVQVIPTITKKNRPAHIFLIDGSEESADEIETVIIRECGSSGWHRIESRHKHTAVTYVKRQVKVKTDGDSFAMEVAGKQIADDASCIRPEYESCRELKERLLVEWGKEISLRFIHSALTELFKNNDSELEFKNENGGMTL